MSTNDAKPRRKKLDVRVHRHESHNKHTKTFSANFNAKNYKNRSDDQRHTDIVVEIPETDGSLRASKKQIKKENVRLVAENKELLDKFRELENLSVRKITKLREKICTLQDANADINGQNEELALQCESLMKCCRDLSKQLELSQLCENCEQLKITIENCTADNNLLRSNNKEIGADLSMLKTVVYRLNVQLERYQECLRKNNIKLPKSTSSEPHRKKEILEGGGENIEKEILSETHRTHKHTPISWGSVHSHTLGPLLDAYEDTLQEKNEIIQNYEVELCNFTGRLKEIVMENESLYDKLTEDEGCSSKLRVELDKLKTELKTTREQNDVLIKKCALKQDKLEEILRVYEAKVSQLKRDFDVLHSEYIRYKTENAALHEKNKCFLDSQEELKDQMQNYIPISVHTASVNECKKWYEELKSQYENEKVKLIQNIDNQAKTIVNLNDEINKINKVKESYEAKIGQLEKHIKKMETKHLELEHNLNQVQLSRSALKKQLHKAMSFAKDMVAEQETLLKALNQRQMENKAVKRIGSDMATRMDSLKIQLKDVQKTAWQEFTTVEQTIQQQADLIDTMKEEHHKEIEKLKKIIKEREESNILLKNDNLPMPHYLLFRDKYQ